MHRPTTPHSSTARTFFEPLENRQFLSISAAPTAVPNVVSAKPAATTVATKTTVSVNEKSLEIGQTLTITVKVKPTSGIATGSVQLLDGGKKTGVTATLNHKGYAVFSFDPGQSVYVGSYTFAARFIGTGKFAGSRSKVAAATVTAPKLTTLTDGLQYATVTKGSGVAATKGKTLTVQYTGFLGSNGSVFDDSASHAPGTLQFKLYNTPEDVIPGFDEGTLGMKVGETRVIVIPSALGYKDNMVRIFVVHLVSIA